MGQKIHPKGIRLGYVVDWESKWFSPREMPELIGEDYRIRDLVKKTFRQAAVSSVVIERAGSYLRVNIHTARPGVVIGKRGSDIEAMRAKVEALTSRKTFINVMEIKEPELDAKLVAEAIAAQLERRMAYRRAMRRAMERTMQAGALGIKVMVGGRLNGSEIARREWLREGRVPLHTYSADIDYGTAEAFTTAGLIGVKVWIFRKQLFVKNPKELLRFVKKQEAPMVSSGAAAASNQARVAAPEASAKPAAASQPAAEAAPDPAAGKENSHADA